MSPWWLLYLLPGAAWTVHMLRHADEMGMSLSHRVAGVPVLLFLWPVMAAWVGVKLAGQLPRRTAAEIRERDRR